MREDKGMKGINQRKKGGKRTDLKGEGGKNGIGVTIGQARDGKETWNKGGKKIKIRRRKRVAVATVTYMRNATLFAFSGLRQNEHLLSGRGHGVTTITKLASTILRISYNHHKMNHSLQCNKNSGQREAEEYALLEAVARERLVKTQQAAKGLADAMNSEEDIPECGPWTVCSKVDLYETPWVERECRCPGRQSCPSQLAATDGHTITDKTRQFKLCEPVKKLPKCRYFRDITWILVSGADNITEQIVQCHCPRGAVAYLIKRQAVQTPDGLLSYRYSFACSPQSRLRCQRKEPCRLFTVRKRQELLNEVNTSTLCQCPHGHTCPRHHTEPGVIVGKSYTEEAIRTYSGYCIS
ncbi:hypothetical protein B7P43_G06234 [Cryptotermes secundus]|uniref:Protein giant-lens n=1 Tax=Cryptotermes secundus TaxID=105785 RepID=A0A2J7RJV2_9NEOP|nr:hypothetical protein B7P43_G06234 [Cryptotermes secundus]